VPDVVRVALAIALKDATIEMRTKTAVVSAVVFSILVLAVLFVARDPTVVAPVDIAPSALWIAFTFAAIIGLNRGFFIERDNNAIDGILLASRAPASLFLGKLLANLMFVGAVELISLPLFVLLYDVNVLPRLPVLLAVIVMATVSFVSIGTLLSAIVVQTRFAELMLPVLLLPFLIPPVVGAVQVTARILADRPLSEMMGWLRLLASFDLVFCVLPILLFEATLDR
jgi:heme exporter protein B